MGFTKLNEGNTSCINEVGDVGIVNQRVSDLGSQGGFRVHVEGKDNWRNWMDITEVEVLEY